MVESNCDVTVIGAGISGLTIAFFLKKCNLSVQVIEKSDRVGGVIESSIKDEFHLEYGPQTCLLEPETDLLLKELHINDQVLFPAPDNKDRYIGSFNTTEHALRDASLHALPKGLLDVIFTPILDPVSKLKLVREYLGGYKRGTNLNIDLRSLFLERFGPRITDSVISVIYLGVWASRLEDLEARSVSPYVFSAYTGGSSILKTLFRHMSTRYKEQGSPRIVSLRKGMEVLPLRLSDLLDENAVHLSVKEFQMSKSSTWDLTFEKNDILKCIRSKIVIFSIPAPSLASMAPSLHAPASIVEDSLKSITYAPMGIIHAVTKKNVHPRGFGVLIPPDRSAALLGAIFTSSLFPEKAPESHSLYTCFVGGAIYRNYEDVTRSEVREKAMIELKKLLSLSEAPEVLDYRYWKEAIPQYRPSHADVLGGINTSIRSNEGLYLCSNFFEGVSIPSRIRASMRLASEITLTHFTH